MKPHYKPSVLFLDDDKDTREMVALTLGLAGMDVALAKDQAEAWELASKHWFELYLLDGLLKSGNAFELCADLREFLPHTPIVFYSGLAFKKDIQRGFDAGATAYLTKPFHGDLAKELFEIMNMAKLPVKSRFAKEPAITPAEMNGECPLVIEQETKIVEFKPKKAAEFPSIGRSRPRRSQGGIV